MSYDLWTNLETGSESRRVTAAVESRNFHKLVAQATRDFGQYLANAEGAADINDRISQVVAELHEAGVKDALSVLEAVAAAQGEDDSDDDSDVPDFVDTDESDDKDRDDVADKDDSDSKDRDDSDDSKKESSKVAFGEDPNSAMQPAGQIPGATQHPVVPRNIAPAVAPQVDPSTQLQPGAQQILGSRSSLPFKARSKR